MKNLEYKIISSAFTKKLEKEVNKAISEGWRPVGGGFGYDGANQAMIRESGQKDVKEPEE